MDRRAFVKGVGAASGAMAAGTTARRARGANAHDAIDRFALVSRHSPSLTAADIMAPFSVGNGEFAFTADVTGLQTFEHEYGSGIPLSTMAQWSFHTARNPHSYSLDTYPRTVETTSGRPIEYVYYERGKSPDAWAPAADWLYANPARFHLGRLGLILTDSKGSRATLESIKAIDQRLDLWRGILISIFEFDGEPVAITTACHPAHNQITAAITSPLCRDGRLTVELAFPYAAQGWSGSGGVWDQPEAHQTTASRGERRIDFERTMDAARYHAALAWSGGAVVRDAGPHRFEVRAEPGTHMLELTLAFAPSPLPRRLPAARGTFDASAREWKRFWSAGGAIDLSGSRNPRWRELERRIVLSRYLTRIQCAGSLPPQETGLTCNSWFGKFHLEMHWWHAAHFPLWGHADLLQRSLPFYSRILPKASAEAKRQGYEGARWPKCVGPAGDPGPTFLECFLIWQQPHPIFYAELLYRADPRPETLKRYHDVVMATAAFMASFAIRPAGKTAFQIGPPVSDAPEVYWEDHAHQWNPGFEVAYWRWGLQRAQRWRERQGLAREPRWDEVLHNLPPLPERDGLYVAADTATETFTKPGLNTSHPCMLAPLGMLDGAGVDRETMRRTMHRIMADWHWDNTWGWDYPMMAMTAARLGEGGTAIDLLLRPEVKNTYLTNGHNFQMNGMLPIYLPGNGGLLYAVALMAAGWDGAPNRHAPGFPDDGSWTVRWEGLRPAP